jgi:4-amino-4-deoxy-L-arabinose transferase-like glycosyltransferase
MSADTVPASKRRPANPTAVVAYAICGAAVIAAGLRLPFIWTGVSIDEGGFAYVTQQWSRGGRLYHDEAWIDRPQGLIMAYRILLAIGDGEWTIRLGAVLTGAALTVLVGLVGWLLLGRACGVAAAAVYAVVGVAPHAEGFTFNGELPASLFATAAVAAALWWRRVGRNTTSWLLVAGVAAGGALTMKQSGFDGLVVGLVVVVASSAPRRLPNAAVFLGGAALPIGVSALHGALTGWGRYWDALVGYQIEAILAGRGDESHTRSDAFGDSIGSVAIDLGLPLLGAILGLWAFRRRRFFLGVLAAWFLAVFVGVNMGGAYWPHYYLQAVPPLVLASVAGVAALNRRRWQLIGALALVAPVLIWLVALIPASAQQRQSTIPYYERALRDERIAAAIEQRTRPTDRIFIVEAEANIYWLAQRTTAYPYIWGKPIDKIPTAIPRLQAVFAAEDRPALVGVQTPPDRVDDSGTVGRLLATHYRPVQTLEGMTLYVRRD